MSETLKPGVNTAAIQAAMFRDLATLEDYAAALSKSERSIWTYISQGRPVTYIGRTPYIVLSKAAAYWADRARQHRIPKRGRPRNDS